jgi:hypothetical protein
MCNCGQKRATLFTPTETIASHTAHIPHAATRPTIRYQYIGSTGLTVFGGACPLPLQRAGRAGRRRRQGRNIARPRTHADARLGPRNDLMDRAVRDRV